MGLEGPNMIMQGPRKADRTTILVLSQSETVCAEFEDLLHKTGAFRVETYVLPFSGDIQTPRITPAPEFILLDVATGTQEDVKLIQQLKHDYGKNGPPIVALLDGGSELGTVRAIRAGAADVLLRPIDVDELQEVFQRLSAVSASSEVHRDTGGKCVAFMHVSGGVGATTLAVNSAVALSSAEGTGGTCLIDLDLQFGATGSLLDLSRISRVEEVISEPERLDSEMLQSLTVTHKSGLRVLTAPRFPIPLEALSENSVVDVLGIAKQSFAYTILDLPVTVTSWTAAALRAADVIYLVVDLSVPSAHRTRRFLELLQNEGLSRLPLKIVANRQGGAKKSGTDVGVKQFAKAIGRDVDYSIPDDYSLVSLSHHQGRAAVEMKPNSAFSKALRQMLSQAFGSKLFEKKKTGFFSLTRK